MWREALRFATEYGNAINEVRIVTGMTAEEADAMSDKFVALASKMSVSATEVGKAAVELYRQGLGDNEVEAR